MMGKGIPEMGTSRSIEEMRELVRVYLGDEVPSPGEQYQDQEVEACPKCLKKMAGVAEC